MVPDNHWPFYSLHLGARTTLSHPTEKAEGQEIGQVAQSYAAQPDSAESC